MPTSTTQEGNVFASFPERWSLALHGMQTIRQSWVSWQGLLSAAPKLIQGDVLA